MQARPDAARDRLQPPHQGRGQAPARSPREVTAAHSHTDGTHCAGGLATLFGWPCPPLPPTSLCSVGVVTLVVCRTSCLRPADGPPPHDSPVSPTVALQSAHESAEVSESCSRRKGRPRRGLALRLISTELRSRNVRERLTLLYR